MKHKYLFVVCPVITTGIVLFGAYINGFDFDHRGSQALSIYIQTVFFGLIGVGIAAALNTL